MTSSTMKKSLEESQPKRHQSEGRANICKCGRPVFAEVAFRDWLKRGNRSISHDLPAGKVMGMPYKHVKLVFHCNLYISRAFKFFNFRTSVFSRADCDGARNNCDSPSLRTFAVQ